MEREANYAAVGAFVLLVVVLGTLFVYWYSDSREHRDYKRYEVYFDGSVSGLARGSAVRYLGVDVGRVYTMRVDPRAATRVQVIVDIDSTAPVSNKTIAELSLQGVTGLLYIDLIADNGTRRLSEPVPSMKYPVIRAARSNFDVFLASLPDLVGLASNVAERAGKMLSDRNIAAVTHALGSIDQASANLPKTLSQINSLVAELRGATDEIRTAAQSANQVVATAGPELNTTLERVSGAADSVDQAGARLQKLIDDNSADIHSFARDSLPEFERFLREGRSAAREIRELAHSLHDDPSQLLYQPPAQGVEVPR